MLGIKAAMEQKRITIKAVSLLLGIHHNSAADKVNGVRPFTVDEALSVQENLLPEYTMGYLFREIKEK